MPKKQSLNLLIILSFRRIMKFNEVIGILKQQWNSTKLRHGYMVVTVGIREKRKVYDNSNLDSLMLTLASSNVDYINSDSLYIEKKAARRISMTVERDGEFYKCSLQK